MRAAKWVVWGTLAQATVLDSMRRKDMAVAGILSVVLVVAAGTFGRFGVRGLEMFLKDSALTVIEVLSSVMAVLFAARQVPEELARRTALPLLARPIGRGDFLFGKFLGAWALSLVALGLFGVVVGGMAAILGVALGVIYWQYLLLKGMALGILCAVALCLSCFTTPPAAVTLSLVIAYGTGTFGRALLAFEGSAHGWERWIYRTLWVGVPQFGLFDLKAKVEYGWPPVAAWVTWALLGYAAVHCACSLALATWRFRRQAL